MALRILVAEDEAVSLKHLTYFLTGEGYAVTGAADGLAALEQVRKEPFDSSSPTSRCRDSTASPSLEEIRAKHPGTEVIIVTGFAASSPPSGPCSAAPSTT